MRRQTFLLFRVYRFQDTEAYGELYDLYCERIHRFVYFKLPKSEDADEVTAEVFLRGWEYATSSRVEHASALFYRIARNVIADFYRKRSDEVGLDAAHELPSGEDVAETAAKNEESAHILSLLRQLKDEYREVLIMRYLDEMSVKEVAAALEKTPNNTRVLLYRAKKALEELARDKS